MSQRKVSRRVFLTLTTAGVGAGAASVVKSPLGSSARAEEVPPGPLDIDSADVPFLHANLRGRGASLAEQFGRPDIAEVFRTECYSEILTAVRTASLEDRARAGDAYLEIFPNGAQLGHIVALLNSVDGPGPRNPVDLDALAAKHLSARGMSPVPLRYVSASPAPDTSGLGSFQDDLASLWKATGTWRLARKHGRKVAATVAADALRAAADHALQQAAPYVPQPFLESVRKDFRRIAGAAGWHVTLADLVDLEDASEPFLAMLSGGVIPVGIGSAGFFDVVAVGA